MECFFFSPARRLFWETPDQFFFYFVFSHLANSSLLHIWGPGHSHLTLPHSRGVVWDWPMWHLEQTGCQFLLLLDSEKVRMFRQDVVVWHIYIYIFGYVWLVCNWLLYLKLSHLIPSMSYLSFYYFLKSYLKASKQAMASDTIWAGLKLSQMCQVSMANPLLNLLFVKRQRQRESNTFCKPVSNGMIPVTIKSTVTMPYCSIELHKVI